MAERPAENPRRTQHSQARRIFATHRTGRAELPSLFAPLPADAPHDRLALARWLVSEQNPLVGRVTVNRHWAALFGRGLVRTTEDFGYQGEPPTHPELLDWLAVEFMREGWSVKQMHKLIVTSATYRQSSRATPELLDKDPQNKLLARAPRFRLDAELVRDVALRGQRAVVGKDRRPERLSAAAAGRQLRRDLRRRWPGRSAREKIAIAAGCTRSRKRTAPYAMFTTFDAPSGEACLARREVSNTPLQSLTLLNDAVFVEAAQALGKRLAAEHAIGRRRAVDDLFRRCVSRPPSDAERAIARGVLHAHARSAGQGRTRRRGDRRRRATATPSSGPPGPSWPGPC